MQSYLLVFFGAGFGGAFRHLANVLTARMCGVGFPYSTPVVNVVGSLLMGVFVGYFALRGESSQAIRLFLTTGILGGFTTFSAFSADVVMLYERGQVWLALTYVLVSVGASISSVFFGLWLVRQSLP